MTAVEPRPADPAPSRRFLPKDWRRVLYVVFGVLILMSLPGLISVAGWWVLLGFPVVAVVVLLAKLSRFCRALAEVIGAILVPWLSLIGFNQLLHWIFDPDVGLVFGLVLAGFVFTVASICYLVAWREKRWATPVVAVVLAFANVVGVPLLLAAPQRETAVAVPQPVVSQLDVAIVVPPSTTVPLRPGEPAAGQSDWDVRFSVARASSAGIEWLLLDSSDAQAALAAARGSGRPLPGDPAPRGGADRVVLLNVDGVPPVIPDPSSLPPVDPADGEIDRWLGYARAAAPDAAVAVLLQTTDAARRTAWETRVAPTGGSVASVQRLGSATLTDAAQVLAARAPGTSEDFAVALRHRPALLFDKDEALDAPLDIPAFLASGRVDLCHDDKLNGSRCDVVKRSSDLMSGSTHLRIRERRGNDQEPVSSIYVHPTRRGDLLFLDYWWYLDGNPAKVAAGTSCGVGLSLPGKTCFDHDSDWEGMTVVLKRVGDEVTPIAVHYAEHGDVVRYGWDQLQADWRDQRVRNRAWQPERFRRNLARIDNLGERPLAFIADGTHAAYRHVCPGGCHQVGKDLTENSHDGLKSWPGNTTASCIETGCLQLIPTRHGGNDPALWNAFEGVWGERDCILRGAYCDAEVSPGAPATQGRYKDPSRITGWVDERWKFHGCGGDRPACPSLAGQ
jgi:hypothetical protein